MDFQINKLQGSASRYSNNTQPKLNIPQEEPQNNQQNQNNVNIQPEILPRPNTCAKQNDDYDDEIDIFPAEEIRNSALGQMKRPNSQFYPQQLQNSQGEMRKCGGIFNTQTQQQKPRSSTMSNFLLWGGIFAFLGIALSK